jgi:hypothetical protein
MAVEVELGEFDRGVELSALDEVDEILIVTESRSNGVEQGGRVKMRCAVDFLAELRSNSNSTILGNLSINPENLVSNSVPEKEPGIKAGDNDA